MNILEKSSVCLEIIMCHTVFHTPYTGSRHDKRNIHSVKTRRALKRGLYVQRTIILYYCFNCLVSLIVLVKIFQKCHPDNASNLEYSYLFGPSCLKQG